MGFLARAAKDWWPLLAAIGTATGAGFGLYHENKSVVRELQREQASLAQRISENLRADLDSRRVGVGGFEDVQIRMGVDAQIRAYLESRGYADRAYFDALFQLNPMLVKPQGR